MPPGGNRPAVEPTVPCETQAPITDLNAATTAPPKQTSVAPAPADVRSAREARSLLSAAVQQSIKHGATALKIPALHSIEFKRTTAGRIR